MKPRIEFSAPACQWRRFWRLRSRSAAWIRGCRGAW
jgi:hypothetical protein